MEINRESYFKEELLKLNKEAMSGKGQVFETYALHFTNLVNSFIKKENISGLEFGIFTSLARETGSYLSQAEIESLLEAMEGCCSHGIDPHCCPAGCGDLEDHIDSEFFYNLDKEDSSDQDLSHNTTTETLDYKFRVIGWNLKDLIESSALDLKIEIIEKTKSILLKMHERFENLPELKEIEKTNTCPIEDAIRNLTRSKRELLAIKYKYL